MISALLSGGLVLTALVLARAAMSGRLRLLVLGRDPLMSGNRAVGRPARRHSRLAAAIRGMFGRPTSGRYDGQLPTAIEVIASELRAGDSLTAALGQASRAVGQPVAGDLLEVLRGATVVGLERSLAGWVTRRPSEGVHLVAAALSMAAATGGGLAPALDGLAASLRSRVATAAEARALSAQARLSAVVIALAPVAFCGFTALTDHTTAGFLLRSPAGWFCLVIGLALDGAGWLWMSRITAIESLP